MPFDALHMRLCVSEIKEILVGGRIDKITAPNHHTVRFAVYAGGKTHGLLLTANPQYAHLRLTTGAREQLESPSVFVNHLRKHLLNGRIDDIFSIKNERIAHLTLTAKNDLGLEKNWTLVVECMGKHSNIILLNSDHKVSESFKHIPLDMSSKRQVLPGLSYKVPPVQEGKISPYDTDGLIEVITRFDKLDTLCHVLHDAIQTNSLQTVNCIDNLNRHLLKHISGLAPATIAEVTHKAFTIMLADNASSNRNVLLPKDSTELLALQHSTDTGSIPLKNALIQAFAALLTPNPFAPCVAKNAEGTLTDFYFTPYALMQGDCLPTPTLNEAMDSYYSGLESDAKLQAKYRRIHQITHTALVRTQKRLTLLLERQAAAENYEFDRIRGELITSNLYRIGKLDKSFTCDNYYVDPPQPITLTLEDGLSPTKTAEKYFKSYRKKKKTLEVLMGQLEETGNEVEYLESVLASLKTAETPTDMDEIFEELQSGGYGKAQKVKRKTKKLSVKETALSGVKRLEYDGYTFLIGKNNIQNDALVKHSAPNDVWLHPKEFRGAHMVILNPKKVLPNEKILRKAATINAKYSKANASDNVPIDYTFIKFVSKPKAAAPGKVVYINQKTLYVNPER